MMPSCNKIISQVPYLVNCVITSCLNNTNTVQGSCTFNQLYYQQKYAINFGLNKLPLFLCTLIDIMTIPNKCNILQKN